MLALLRGCLAISIGSKLSIALVAFNKSAKHTGAPDLTCARARPRKSLDPNHFLPRKLLSSAAYLSCLSQQPIARYYVNCP